MRRLRRPSHLALGGQDDWGDIERPARFEVTALEQSNRLRRLAQAALSVAHREADRGAGESMAEGNNQGPDIRAYRRGRGGRWLRGPWCADFVSWCFEEAATAMEVELPFARSSSAWALTRRLAAVGRWLEENEWPLPGDVICWRRGAGASRWKSHVALVAGYSVDADLLWGVDGNRGKVPALVATWTHPRGVWRRRLRGIVRLA